MLERSRVPEKSGTELSVTVRLGPISLCSVHLISGSNLSPQCRHWRRGGVGGLPGSSSPSSSSDGSSTGGGGGAGAASAAWADGWFAGSPCAAPDGCDASGRSGGGGAAVSSEVEGHVVLDRGSPEPVKRGWAPASSTAGGSPKVASRGDFPAAGAGDSTAGAGTAGGSSPRRSFTQVGRGRVDKVHAVS